MPAVEYRVQLGSWAELKAEATPIRFAVFVDEQKVPAEIEIDEWDEPSLHAVARDAQGRAVGTGRLLPDGRVGRMAVRPDARGAGVGSLLLTALIEAARARGQAETVLSAQTHAIPFYRRHGFIEEGGVYDDAGIPHQSMRRGL
jgi:predicted GNAT family N-acyltransferase